jgi:hydrogenase expression/formation protein HypE
MHDSGEILGLGKLPYGILGEILSEIRSSGTDILVGPTIGEDAAVVKIGDTDYVMLVHSDPITEASSRVGWLSINVAANDIAVSGARPSWFVVTLLFPPNIDYVHIKRIIREMKSASDQIGGKIIGGHTEVSPGISKTIIITTAIGVTKSDLYVRTGSAKPGSLVFQVKPAALEGTAILAHDFKEKLIQAGVDPLVLKKAEKFIEEISVVKPAVTLAENKLAESMHDPTEGGILGGLIELAKASNVSLEIDASSIIVREETKLITKALGVDWLKLVSSGSIIGTIKPEAVETARELMRNMSLEFGVIGVVKKYSGFDVYLRDRGAYYSGYVREELSRLIEENYNEV